MRFLLLLNYFYNMDSAWVFLSPRIVYVPRWAPMEHIVSEGMIYYMCNIITNISRQLKEFAFGRSASTC